MLTEYQHQVAVVDYCNVRRWPVWATDQAMFTRNFPALNRRKKMGVRPGMADLLVFIPNCFGWGTRMVFIEMKKEKGKRGGANGSKIAKEQIEFGRLCANANVRHFFCFGAQDAIKVLNAVEKGLDINEA